MAKHFTDERWYDYVRGVLAAAGVAAIEQHLERGCEECRQSFRLWRTVAETASNEVRAAVPEGLERMAHAAYIGWRQLSLLPRRATMARILFDSLLEPLPAGVRSEASSGRRILGRAGSWSFDLRFEPAAGKHLFLMGQVLRSGRGRGRGALPVLLMSTDTVIAETAANQFGEFQLQFDQAKDLRIYIDVPGNRPIGISLPDFDNPSPAPKPRAD